MIGANPHEDDIAWNKITRDKLEDRAIPSVQCPDNILHNVMDSIVEFLGSTPGDIVSSAGAFILGFGLSYVVSELRDLAKERWFGRKK